MRRTKKLIMAMSLLIHFFVLGCSNVFEGASNKETDPALFEDAQKAIDDQDWDTALSKFNSLSANYKTNPEVIEAWAGAYAGKCGLDFIGYFTSLGSANLSGVTIMTYLMQAWKQKAINPTYCTLAQRKMEEISTSPANRTSGENIFMAVLGMVKVGVFLRSKADVDGAGNLGDGSPDGTFNVCTNDNANMPDASLDEVITGIGLVTNNLAALTAVLSAGDITNALNSLNSACASSPGSCGKTDPTTINTTDRDLFRDLLNTGPSNSSAPIGIGNCNNAAVAPCC